MNEAQRFASAQSADEVLGVNARTHRPDARRITLDQTAKREHTEGTLVFLWSGIGPLGFFVGLIALWAEVKLLYAAGIVRDYPRTGAGPQLPPLVRRPQ